MKPQLVACIKITLIVCCLFVTFSCNTQKESVVGRGMHNLTARYNYLYHAHEVIENFENEQRDDYATNFQNILPVYIVADSLQNQDTQIDKVIEKAKTVIAEKSTTKYMAEAYLILAKANFLKGDYFLAQAYYEYVGATYPEDLPLQVQALNGQARSLLQLNQLNLAIPVLNKLALNIAGVKRNKAEPLATLAQANIRRNDYATAISYLEASLKQGGTKKDKIRRIFILAQLEERLKNYPKALQYYLKVQHSNADFDLYFHSNLNRIKISGLQRQEIDKKQEIKRLIAEDKNTAYADQLYYELAETHLEEQNYDLALAHFEQARKVNTTNSFQKGLIFKKIALLQAKHFRNYSLASSYYDSSLNALPKTYAGYDDIKVQHKNMQYLASRYETITLQDSLQRIAKLPNQDRQQKIQTMFSQEQVAAQHQAAQFPTFYDIPTGKESDKSSTFYFDNPTAISKGASDFKKQWGNRKLADNWRQSIRSSEAITEHSINKTLQDPDARDDRADNLQQKMHAFEASLPLTPTLLAASNHKIMEAYLQLGNFYADELAEPEEAQKVFKLLSDRFPNSTYAQTQLKPEWRRQKAANDRQQLLIYNEVYQAYESKNYAGVIETVNQVSASPDSATTLTAQLLYLQALAIGRTAPVADLLQAFQSISLRFPEDPLVSPLVKAHQRFIQQHLPTFQKRKVALADTDEDEPPFIKKTITIAENKVGIVASVNDSISTNLPITPPGIFSKTNATDYYFVVQVADVSVTLSSSRFGIGQFNRGNYAEYGLKHQLREIDNQQLIYIGNFVNFADVSTYAEGIRPQLKQIMKVRESDYTSFIISKENFDKITSEDLLNKYIVFYKNNY